MTLNNLFVDTSWYKALVDERDDFNKKAIEQYKKLRSQESFLITTNFIIDESLTLIRAKNGLKVALKFRDTIFEMAVNQKIVRVTAIDEKEAWKWFPKNWSRLSFTDCTSFAVMKRLGLKDVLTFDKHFSRAGFNVFF